MSFKVTLKYIILNNFLKIYYFFRDLNKLKSISFIRLQKILAHIGTVLWSNYRFLSKYSAAGLGVHGQNLSRWKRLEAENERLNCNQSNESYGKYLINNELEIAYKFEWITIILLSKPSSKIFTPAHSFFWRLILSYSSYREPMQTISRFSNTFSY